MIPAAAPHAQAIGLLHAAAFGPEAWSEASIATLFASPGVFGFIDEAGGCVIARTVADEAEILTIGVIPAARRRGLGWQLLGAALHEAGRRGASAVFLEVAADNAAARALYARAGFAEAGRRRDYYGAGQDALLLRRTPCE
ncbi:GNAT family N-acetyltransferase [Acidiphilium iwatense]|uniref:GNAT family N-acetyltransferase n=1 Tax=Acidiphilium iwatense TaxID=768198 RepID=A0ABS9DYP1_9PROT|nr:GNAT family N-acetyltransferase [Acidiphilium iwatense]MCF3947871.1 GNAT family N-acetyltransferase [Acidiphilium iwatense]